MKGLEHEDEDFLSSAHLIHNHLHSNSPHTQSDRSLQRSTSSQPLIIHHTTAFSSVIQKTTQPYSLSRKQDFQTRDKKENIHSEDKMRHNTLLQLNIRASLRFNNSAIFSPSKTKERYPSKNPSKSRSKTRLHFLFPSSITHAHLTNSQQSPPPPIHSAHSCHPGLQVRMHSRIHFQDRRTSFDIGDLVVIARFHHYHSCHCYPETGH